MLDEVEQYLRQFVITHRGKTRAVVIPAANLENWEETLDIQSNKKLMREIRKAEQDFKAGKYYTLDDVEKELHQKTKRHRVT